MKQVWKKTISAALVFLFAFCILPAIGLAATEGDFDYTVSGTEATITKYLLSSSGTNAVIPDTLGGCPVTAIGKNAFFNSSKLESVTFPNTIKTIGNSAFYDCGLKSLTIPDSVTTIGANAFESCGSLQSVSLGKGLQTIGDYAFFNCNGIQSLNIPDNVTTIGENAFNLCNGLQTLTIGNGPVAIGRFAFGQCPELKTVTLGSNVKSLGGYAFGYCGKLESITLPASLQSIGERAFYHCLKLKSINLPDKLTSIGIGAFGYTGLGNLVIPGGITKIQTLTCEGCAALKSITIGKKVTTIENDAFKACTSLTIYGYKNSYAQSYANSNAIPFIPLDATYTINAVPSNTNYGSVTGGGNYSANTSIVLKAIPKDGYRFVRWSEGGKQVLTNAVYSFIVTKGRTLKAEFASIGVPKLNSAASSGYNAITLKWSAVPGAAGYIVYRSTKSTSGFNKVGTVPGTSFSDSSLKTGMKYYYRMKAYCKADNTVTWGNLSNVNSAIPVPGKPSAIAATVYGRAIKLSWSSVAGATNYEVCRSIKKTTGFKLLKTVSTTNYKDSSAAAGKTYYYKVRAYRLVNGKKIYGDYSKIVSRKY